MLGIEKLKQAALLGAQLGHAVEDSLEGGITLADLANFVTPLLQIPAVLANKAIILAEFKDLDDAERAELIAYIKANFDLEDDKVENVIERSLVVVVAILELVDSLKKEDLPE